MVEIKLKIYHNRFFWKCIIFFVCCSFNSLLLILLICGFERATVNDITLILCLIFGITIIGFLIYFLIRYFNKSYYLFDENNLYKIKKNQETIKINWRQIYEIFYIRFRWILLMQFGSGFLVVKFLNEKGEKKQHEIALSLKQVNIIAKTFNKSIIIK
jgi:hypothetical protein